MKPRLFLNLLLAFMLLLTGCTSKHTEESGPGKPSRVNSFSQLRQFFADPPVEYRSAPLWVWNNDVTEEEIDRQLDDLKGAGIGGVFIHPRPGLITPYISDQWHSLCRYPSNGQKSWA